MVFPRDPGSSCFPVKQGELSNHIHFVSYLDLSCLVPRSLELWYGLCLLPLTFVWLFSLCFAYYFAAMSPTYFSIAIDVPHNGYGGVVLYLLALGLSLMADVET